VRVCVPVSGVFSLSVGPECVWHVDCFTKQAQSESNTVFVSCSAYSTCRLRSLRDSVLCVYMYVHR